MAIWIHERMITMRQCKRGKRFILLLTCFLLLTACGKTEEAQAVDDLISSIGEVKGSSEKAISEAEEAYNALTEKEQESLDNYDALVEARNSVDTLKAKAAEEVIEKISTVSENSKQAITQARMRYNELSDTQKSLVSNYDTLADAEQAFEVVMLAKVEEVETLINSIGEIIFSDKCEQMIKRAEDAYSSLDIFYRSEVKNGQVLTDARNAYNQLSPIQLNSYRLQKNILGYADIYMSVKNITEKIMKEFTLRIFAYDDDGVPVKVGLVGFSATLNYTDALKPGSTSRSTSYWSLNGIYNEMKQIVVYAEEVEFYDGTIWENPQSSSLYARYNEKLLEEGDENILSRG